MTPERRRTLVWLLIGGAAVLLIAAGAIMLTSRMKADAPPALESVDERENVAEARKDVPVESPPPPEARGADALAEADRQKAREPLVVDHLGARRVSCGGACAMEEQCGLRTATECRAASCEGELRKLSRSDFALKGLEDCAAVAEGPCEEACWKRGECTGHHDRDTQCTRACRTLVKQAPRETFRESRCVLERACADLPLCAEQG